MGTFFLSLALLWVLYCISLSRAVEILDEDENGDPIIDRNGKTASVPGVYFYSRPDLKSALVQAGLPDTTETAMTKAIFAMNKACTFVPKLLLFYIPSDLRLGECFISSGPKKFFYTDNYDSNTNALSSQDVTSIFVNLVNINDKIDVKKPFQCWVTTFYLIVAYRIGEIPCNKTACPKEAEKNKTLCPEKNPCNKTCPTKNHTDISTESTPCNNSVVNISNVVVRELIKDRKEIKILLMDRNKTVTRLLGSQCLCEEKTQLIVTILASLVLVLSVMLLTTSLGLIYVIQNNKVVPQSSS